MHFFELAEKRYSCRKFSDKKVDSALLDKIIEAGRIAPTAVNRQPFKIFNMASKTAKNNIREVTRFNFGADAFLVVGYRAEEGWVRSYDGRNFADVDASIVATHMMLAIEELGLSTTWVGHFNAPLLKEKYPEMKDYELIAIFPIGYAAEDAEPAEKHFIRKSSAELVTVL